MKIAVVGLGKMGAQIAKKLHESGLEVIAHNKSRNKIDEAKMLGMTAAYTKEEVVSSFNKEQVIIWLMLPTEAVDQELDIWLKLIPQDSILIDGGNSDFRRTKERAKKVSSFESTLVDVGVSGGIWGYKNGFSMMAGGKKESFDIIAPLLEALSKPSGAYYRFGESGAGHYVKMVHNAIEYGMMESLAEGYRLLKEGPYKHIDLASAGDVWQHRSVVTSWLNELSRDALKENPELKGIEGYVSESGEARWALEVANNLKIEMPAILSSFKVRLESQKGKTNFATKLLAAMRNAFGGHRINKDE
ncbi:MAG TPA: NADP-dependent phosphogluconate dehydrogenase [Candidatus Paceibacterota bacterium]|nr:NADP-dependent phosphogluconate dehydrogenase [Candidatus Paceibacterota bacterium]